MTEQVTDGVEDAPPVDDLHVNGGDPLPEPDDDTPPLEDDADVDAVIPDTQED